MKSNRLNKLKEYAIKIAEAEKALTSSEEKSQEEIQRLKSQIIQCSYCVRNMEEMLILDDLVQKILKN